MVTWFAVRTGLPSSFSRTGMWAAVCRAVSGRRTASASGWSAARARASTSDSVQVPTSAAVMMPELTTPTASMPAARRNSAKSRATSSG